MSLLWIARAVNLLVLLPSENPEFLKCTPSSYYCLRKVIISYLKPKPRNPDAVSSHEHISKEMLFDRRLAQYSLAIDAVADTMVALSPTASQVPFIALSCLSSFTSGGNPGMYLISLTTDCLADLFLYSYALTRRSLSTCNWPKFGIWRIFRRSGGA